MFIVPKYFEQIHSVQTMLVYLFIYTPIYNTYFFCISWITFYAYMSKKQSL